MDPLELFVDAVTLRAGYNSAIVTVGAGLLGLAAGAAGAFIFLRKRALISDAITHATLPGVAIAFMVMVAIGGDGRWLPGLVLGSACSSALGLWLVHWISRRTRLGEDAAIGAVLSVSFGLGVVLLTVIQTLTSGRPAGLESFLLGSTAGMLLQESVSIALAGAVAAALVFALRRPMTMVAFDAEHASAIGIDVNRTDLAMMGLALLVTVIGLKVVGLILIVAMLIVPPVAARFWTDRVDRLVLIAAGIGGASGYLGAALSSVAADLPTGPVIVLVAFSGFAVSLVASPTRGILASMLRHRRFQHRVHRRQGLRALARGEPIYDRLTLSVLGRTGLIRGDGVLTDDGREAAARAQLDEARWAAAQRLAADDPVLDRYDGLTPIDELLTPDQVAHLDSHLPRPELAT